MSAEFGGVEEVSDAEPSSSVEGHERSSLNASPVFRNVTMCVRYVAWVRARERESGHECETRSILIISSKTERTTLSPTSYGASSSDSFALRNRRYDL